MLALFLFLLIGYFMKQRGILDAHGSRAISWLIINIACPCMIMSGALSGSGLSRQMFMNTLILCIAAYTALILFSLFIPAVLGIPGEQRNLYQIMTIFSNIGFMGFPLLSAMYGPGCLVYASLATVLYNIIFYTYGIRTMQKDADTATPLRLTNIINPGTLACAAALVLALFQPPLPTFVVTAIENLGSLPAALSMIVIGASLTDFELSDIFSDRRDLLFALVKLIVIPVVLILTAKIFVSDPVLLGILLIVTATPVGSMVVMAVQQYGANEKLAARNVALTTILSVVTMPLVALIVGL